MIDLSKYRLPLKKADVYLIPDFLDKATADLYLLKLMETIKFEKKEKEGRMTALLGHAKKYKYALNDDTPLPWTEELSSIKTKIENATSYNHDVCLLNYYQNGKEGFRFHTDKEEIGNEIPIASISLGAERKFYFRSLVDKDEQHSILLTHGSLLIMGPGTHENYIHSLPSDKKIKLPRLNLTFRKTRPNNNPSLLDVETKIVPENKESPSPLKEDRLKTTVVNKKNTKDYDVYIGRPSKWGNPYVIGRDGTREEVIAKHRVWIKTQTQLLNNISELVGKRLACYCAPERCHGDILAELANAKN